MEANSRERPLELQAVDVKVVNSTRCERWHRGNHIYVRIPLPLPETNPGLLTLLLYLLV